MTSAWRLRALAPQGFELLLIIAVVVLSLDREVEGFEVAAHALFALSTMAMINCFTSCREKFHHCFVCLDVSKVLQRLHKHTAVYDKLHKKFREGLLVYFGATILTGLAWVLAALSYAQSIHDGHLSKKLLGFAIACICLSGWKMWDMTKHQRELSVAGIAFALTAVDVDSDSEPATRPSNPR